MRIIIFAGNRPFYSHYFRILCWKPLTSKQKNPVSMTYGLRVIIIAGNGPYFSHYFQFLCWKTQNPVSTTYGFRVLCLIHICGVITHCRVTQVYPLINLHLWCPRLKKDGHLRCRWGICHLFWWLFFFSFQICFQYLGIVMKDFSIISTLWANAVHNKTIKQYFVYISIRWGLTIRANCLKNDIEMSYYIFLGKS